MVKITKKELQKLIDEAVKAKLALNESTDFSAKRQIVHSAQHASMEFEREITKALGLVEPDKLQPALQKRYFEIAEEMKRGIIKSVVDAVGRFATLPRNTKSK
jgi:polyhydroxyalkanoate synthesis regulator phasin